MSFFFAVDYCFVVQDIDVLDQGGPFEGFSSSVQINTDRNLNSALALDTFDRSHHDKVGTLMVPKVIGVDILPIYEVLNSSYFALVSEHFLLSFRLVIAWTPPIDTINSVNASILSFLSNSVFVRSLKSPFSLFFFLFFSLSDNGFKETNIVFFVLNRFCTSILIVYYIYIF